MANLPVIGVGVLSIGRCKKMDRFLGRCPTAKRSRAANGSAFVLCPICGASVAMPLMNSHLDSGCAPAAPKPAAAVKCQVQPVALDNKSNARKTPLGVIESGTPSQNWMGNCSLEPAPEDTAASNRSLKLAPADTAASNHSKRLATKDTASSSHTIMHTLANTTVSNHSLENTPANKQSVTQSASHNQIHNTVDTRLHAIPGELPGQYIVPDFLSVDEEIALMHFLDCEDSQEWKLGFFNGPARRKAWGVKTNLKKRSFGEPEWHMPPLLIPVTPTHQ